MSSLYFQILSFVYIAVLAITFFSKPRIKSIENNLFTSLIIINIIGVILDIVSTYLAIAYEISPLLNLICKVYLLYIVGMCLVFTLYVLYISTVTNETTKEQKESPFFRATIETLIIFMIVMGSIFILPLYNFSEQGVIYTYGPAATLTYIIASSCAIVWLFSLIRNFKNIINKKYLPVFALVFLAIIVGLLQMAFPELLLVTSMFCLVTFIMFFTIENPDVKLINELNIAKEQAEQANNYKTEFLSSMSHEIRTPLNAIVGFSNALAEEDIPQNAKDEVKDIVMASNLLLDIVNGILDISKIEANKLEIVNNEYNPHKMLKELVSLAEARMGDKALEFKTSFDPSIPGTLYGDQSRLKQIIVNLLTNAIKYTKEGWFEFKVNCLIKDNVCRLIFTVEDSGIGIKTNDLNKLFNKFERLGAGNTSSIEGTGLGLAITKKLVELMGGQIVVQSEIGKGSKFSVAIDQRIIQAEPSVEKKLADTQLIQNVDLSDKKVLIVDDNKMNLKVASRLLSMFNLQIDTLESGYECIDKIKAKEYYDLILLDDMMPKMSGTETLKILKEDPEFKIPVVALTANAIAGMREKYIESGFNDYLAKPIEKPELYRVLLEYLSNQK